MDEAKRGSRRRCALMDERLAEASHPQAIEGSPLSPGETAMFEMFGREGWSPEDRRGYIARKFRGRGHFAAAG